MLKSQGKKFLVVLAACAMLGTTVPTGAAYVVFDPSNFVKNTITSLQSVKMVAEQVKNYALDLQRYKNELEQAAKFDASSLVFRNVDQDLQNSMQIINDLNSVYGSIESAKSVMEMEMRNYSMSRHKSFEDYITAETTRVEREGKGRVSAFQAERNAIKNAQTQMEQIQKLADQIKAPVGIQQSLQTTNQQLNLMAAQNAQLMQVIANKQALDNERAAMDAAKQQSQMEGEKKAIEALRAANREYKKWAAE